MECGFYPEQQIKYDSTTLKESSLVLNGNGGGGGVILVVKRKIHLKIERTALRQIGTGCNKDCKSKQTEINSTEKSIKS